MAPLLREDWRAFGWLWSEIRPDLVILVGTPLAILASLHILLSKREVPSAIAWIGFVWFAPILGPVLYSLFGISRVRRRALDVRRDVLSSSGSLPGPREGLASLETAIGTITGQGLAPGNRIAILRNGDQAYPEMLRAIEGATNSILLTTYIMRPDRIGSSFIEALAKAHRRGVRVRVIVDGIGGGYFVSAAYRHLRAEGVPVQRFMHSALPWRMPFLNLRTHKKLTVVDGRVAFIGGLNIGDEDLLAATPTHPVRDTHFRIEGPVAAQLSADFARDWSFLCSEDLTIDQATPQDVEAKAEGAACRAISSGPDENIEKIEFAVLQAIACARSSIHMMTPYFLPGEMVTGSLAMAAMRGIAVDILIPSRSNRVFVDWAARQEIEPLLAQGVRVWRVPPPFDHSKLLVIDRGWCLVGSANMDVRSLRLNFELNVEAYDRQVASSLVGGMESLMVDRVSPGELAQRTLVTRMRDALARLALPYL